MLNPKKRFKKMKKFILSLGLIAMAFGLTNCTQNEEFAPVVEPQGDFVIYASTETRTANDGLNTVWATGDDMGVFHAIKDGTTYTKDGQFKLQDAATGQFLGNVNGTLDPEKEYDWYAMYPYSSYVPGPKNESSGYMTIGCASNETQTQTGNNSMAHVAGKNYPLVGKAYAVPENQSPALAMTHVATLLEFKVTNSLEEDITVSNIKFTAPEAIVGTFYIDFTNIDNITATLSGSSYTSKSATLTVKDGEAIEAGESAKFYLPVAPFVANANAKLSIELNVTSGEKVGTLVKEITLADATSFKAGKIKTVNVNYNAEFVEEGIALPFSDDFSWVTKDENNGVLAVSDLSSNYLSAETVYGSKGELKFGKSDAFGSLTTQPFNLSQPFTVVVDAMAYSNDTAQLSVTVNGVTKTTGDLSIGVYKKYMFQFDAATAASTIQFDITGKRGYIDNLEIVAGHDYVLPPVLTVTPETLTFDSPASSQTITCSIENEVSGASITATENVDWLSTSVSGNTVTVTATENTGADRNANVTIAYGDVSKTIPVQQLAPSTGKEETEEMEVIANKGKLSNNVITWTGTYFTFSNAKGESTNAIRTTDSDHFRVYANSTITLTAQGGKKFKKVVFTCTTSSYATALQTTLGSSATASGSTVTWTGNADTITAKATAQIRINKIVATLQ